MTTDPSYPSVSLQHLPALADGVTVMLIGRYSRHPGGTYLTQGGARVQLVGEPFTWLPPQHAPVEVWGELLQGIRPRLLLHDARPRGAPAPVPAVSPPGQCGEPLTLMARVTNVGTEQLATTADRHSYVLVGEELDERPYCLKGLVLTLDPPTLRLEWAIPVTPTVPNGTSADHEA